MKTLLPVKDVAERLGLHPSSVYRAIDRGDLEAVRVSRHKTLIPIDAIATYLEDLNE